MPRTVAWRLTAVVAAISLLLAGCTAAEDAPAWPGGHLGGRSVAPPDPIRQYAIDRLSVMSLDQKIASLLMVHQAGLDPSAIGSFAAANGVGGLILMGDNIPDPPAALATMTPMMSSDRGLPLLVATDQEGGIVSRIWTDDGLAAEQLRGLDPEVSREAFAARGALLRSLGVTVNFGVVADVTADPDSFIYDRSMGGTPGDAAARVAAAVSGENGEVLTTLKHFPGHGVSPADSHSSIPETAIGIDDWRAGHEAPFAAGVAAGAEFVMFGHLQFDAVDAEPATLSPMWHQLLRDELGFDGIAITDDMNMLQNSGRPDLADQYQNAVRAVAAGNDMLLYVGEVDIPGVVAAVHSAVVAGTIPMATINDAALRLLVLRRTLSGETGHFVHCFENCQSIIE